MACHITGMIYRKKSVFVYYIRKDVDLRWFGQVSLTIKGKAQLCRLGKTAEGYCTVMDSAPHALLDKNVRRNRKVLFQHKEAPVHTAAVTSYWLVFNFSWVINWSVRFPDFNFIENTWGAMDPDVYR